MDLKGSGAKLALALALVATRRPSVASHARRLVTMKILLQLILFIGTAHSCTVSGTLWHFVTVDETKLPNDGTTSLSATSKLICAIRATQASWCHLFCYRDHQCLLSDFEVPPDTYEAAQGVVYSCWTRSFGGAL